MSTDVLDQLATWCSTLEDRIEPVTASEVLDRRAATGRDGRDSRSPVDVPLRSAGRGRRRLGWSLIASAATLASVVGVWLVRDRPATPVESTPVGSLPSDTAPSDTGPVVEAPRAQDELARLVAQAINRLGWEVAMPDAVVASTSSTRESESYAEVRFALPGRGELLVSAAAGDGTAAAIGTADGTALRTVGTASVYVRADSDTARAVELLDRSTIVYVRSESTGGAQTLDDLATIALDVDAAWAPDTVTFDGPPTTVYETVPATAPATATATGPMVIVHHTSVRVTLDATITCERPIESADTFTSFVVDSYADLEGRRWLTRTTYPDGSTWERISLGDPLYADAAFSRGESLGRLFGCVDPAGERYILGADPAPGPFYALTMAADVPDEDIPYLSPAPWPDAVATGAGVDDAGRSADLWLWTIDGFGGYGNAEDLRLQQTQTWWVDPDVGVTVLQHRFVNEVDGMGTATSTELLVTDEHVEVPADVFDTAGAEPTYVTPRPMLVDPPWSDETG